MATIDLLEASASSPAHHPSIDLLELSASSPAVAATVDLLHAVASSPSGDGVATIDLLRLVASVPTSADFWRYTRVGASWVPKAIYTRTPAGTWEEQ